MSKRLRRLHRSPRVAGRARRLATLDKHNAYALRNALTVQRAPARLLPTAVHRAALTWAVDEPYIGCTPRPLTAKPVVTRNRPQPVGLDARPRGVPLRHASEQNFTDSQSRSHFLRHVNGRWQTGQVLLGSGVRGMTGRRDWAWSEDSRPHRWGQRGRWIAQSLLPSGSRT